MTAAPQLPRASEKPYVDSFELDPLYMRKCMGVRWLGKNFKGNSFSAAGFEDWIATPEKRAHKFSIGDTSNASESKMWLRFGSARPQINLPFLFPKLYWTRRRR